MGMFDTISVDCPKCSAKLHVQTKTGPCVLNTYSLDEIPVDMAEYLDGTIDNCGHCGYVFHIVLAEPLPKMTIKMKLEESKDE
jgi:uncharacterized Zn finger protein